MRAKWLVCLMALLLALTGPALAENALTASVHVRASRNVRDSVIRAGEDVDLTVSLTGFVPAACQWYFSSEALEGENGASLHIAGAQVSDTGLYRMDAMDETGRVRVSVDVALRVVDEVLPQTGDGALPVVVPASAMALSGGLAALLIRKRRALDR